MRKKWLNISGKYNKKLTFEDDIVLFNENYKDRLRSRVVSVAAFYLLCGIPDDVDDDDDDDDNVY